MAYMKDPSGKRLDSFVPSRDLPGTIAHLDSARLSGGEGSNVTNWQSEFGGFALNRTLATKPTLLLNAQNGRKAVRFTPSSYLGNSDTFGAGGLGILSGIPLPLTIIMVFRISTTWTQSNDAVLLGSTGVNLRLASAGQNLHIYAGLDSTKAGPALNDGNWHICIAAAGNGGAAVYMDGFVTTVSTSAIGTNSMNSLFVGPGQGAAPSAGTFDVGEVIVTDRPISPSRADIITQQLAKKWGLS